MFKNLIDLLDSFLARDPSARTRWEVVLCYPGLHILCFHRVAHLFWKQRWYLLARLIAQLGRFLTGIEIHPAARIGKRLFIDHGSGVVIGKTAEIGDDVTLYHGVTLGGRSMTKGKRHPTIEDRVVLGAGTQVIGPVVIGADARVGANVLIISDIPAGSIVVAPPGMVRPKGYKPLSGLFDQDLEKDRTVQPNGHKMGAHAFRVSASSFSGLSVATSSIHAFASGEESVTMELEQNHQLAAPRRSTNDILTEKHPDVLFPVQIEEMQQRIAALEEQLMRMSLVSSPLDGERRVS